MTRIGTGVVGLTVVALRGLGPRTAPQVRRARDGRDEHKRGNDVRHGIGSPAGELSRSD